MYEGAEHADLHEEGEEGAAAKAEEEGEGEVWGQGEGELSIGSPPTPTRETTTRGGGGAHHILSRTHSPEREDLEIIDEEARITVKMIDFARMCPLYMCTYVSSYVCVLMLLHMCPRTSRSEDNRQNDLFRSHVSLVYVYICVLLCMCPHTAAYVSSYC